VTEMMDKPNFQEIVNEVVLAAQAVVAASKSDRNNYNTAEAQKRLVAAVEALELQSVQHAIDMWRTASGLPPTSGSGLQP